MAVTSLRDAATRLNAINAVLLDYLDAYPDDAPPSALLREVANAGRDLVTAIGEHIATAEPHTTEPQARRPG